MSELNTNPRQRGLTWRSGVVTLVALLVMGIWIEYVERFNFYDASLAENSPPNSAVGVILLVMGLSALLYHLRRGFRLTPPELVVIYTALVLAAPLMCQGLWGRLFGILTWIPHNQDYKSYNSLPSVLWPHGPNLIPNHRFKQGLEGFTHVGGGTLNWEEVEVSVHHRRKCPVLSNGDDAEARSALVFSLGRHEGNRETLVPGERYLFSMLVKADELQKNSLYSVTMQADNGPSRPLLLSTGATKPTFSSPGGLQRVGGRPVAIPTELRDRLCFTIGLTGPGKLSLQDLEFFNVEAVEGLFSGRKMVSEHRLATLDDNERDFMVVKPRHMLSVRGLKYLVTGYIPLREWLLPGMAWSSLIGGLFIGFLGLNLLLRRQWGEHERFSFPLTIVPKYLFGETDPQGTIFRSRIMWIGFACMLPLVLLKGIHFYYPSVPAPIFPRGSFSQYVSSPLAKAFLQDVGIGTSLDHIGGVPFSVIAIALLIETNVLFSLLATFFLFQLWNLFGTAFNFNRFPGYCWPGQQIMGAFIAYAALALFVARRHLKEVFVRIWGGRQEGASAMAAEIGTYRMALLMVTGALAILVVWGIWTDMGVRASLLFFGYMLVLGFAASKIRAECGVPFAYWTPWAGVQFLSACGGFAVLGSKGMLVATMASMFMTGSCFLLIAPVQVEMMEVGRHFNMRLRDVGAGLWLGLFGGLFIGGFVLLCWAYGFGANNLRAIWPYENTNFGDFRAGELNADRAFGAGTLFTTPETRPLDFIHNPDARGLGIGAFVTLVLAFLRSRLAWFPFHPLGYVLASSYFMQDLWLAILIAWVTRAIVFKIGGAQTIRKGLIPLCIGMFLACIVSIIFFDLAGIYLRTQGITSVYCQMP